MTMRRIATLLLTGAFLCVLQGSIGSASCEAQLVRGWLQRNAQAHTFSADGHSAFGQYGAFNQLGRVAPSPPRPQQFPTEAYFPENRNPVISRILDGKMTHRYRDPAEVDSRYIGGFHLNHFNNLGIPSGDIGIRGNAYNWFTW